ncbi:integrin beta-like protein 1 [Ruditapes philippinarum]|uniref:integrin beta-like protein 1 n=1 Tax=Ruditapes philippinarum TaxID=129788 RepID=UPI00295A7FD2|nr:integrin beta-like protein 1 [Ruditapes philippinarum]
MKNYGVFDGGHGRCSCGQCECEPGYTGEACECPTSSDSCMASNGMICNGVGNCVCGECMCDKDSYFRGPTCEECPILEPKHPQCNHRGMFDPCGTCKCEPYFYGDMCECEANYRIPDRDTAMAACTDSGSAEPCNGRGECKCGSCECFSRGSNMTEGYFGRYCECDDFSCPKHEGKLCGGHGRCVCGECQCDTGYSGEACDCTTDTSTCKSSNGLLCNGHGSCICGECVCEETFRGPKCEDCPIQEHEFSSELCSYRGTNMCGDCVCDEGHYGKACECDVMPEMTREEVMRQCISPNSTTGVMCSGRGECICGFCSCNPLRPQSSQVYSGQFCECNDYSCSYSNNRICAGHGRCSCGQCECEPGYTGEACDCPTSSDSCMASNGMICNGVGNCVCGVCLCDKDSYFRGPTCEECPTCPGVCQTYKSCVFCILGSGEYTKEYCSTNCQMRNIEIVDSLNLDGENGGETPKQCSYWDETDDVNVLFTYTYDDFNQILIKVQRRDMN